MPSCTKVCYNKITSKCCIIIVLVLVLIVLVLVENKTENFRNKNKNKNKNRNIVFTSCGDNTNFHNLWCDVDRNYDIYAI